MHPINDPQFVSRQYQSDRNLNARIALHQRFSTNKTPWSQRVFDQLLAALGARADAALHLLELGAGPGTLWAENQARIPASWRVVLSDLSPGMVATAQRNLAAALHRRLPRGGRAAYPGRHGVVRCGRRQPHALSHT